MKVEVSKDALEKKLSYARGFAETRSGILALGHVHVEARKTEGVGQLILTTTNLEISYSGVVDCAVKEEGKVCLNAAKFLDIAKSLNRDAPVFIQTGKDEKCLVKSARSRFSLNSLNPDEFPNMSSVQEDKTIPINPFTLLRGIRKARRGTSKALLTGRAVLESLLFRFESGGKFLKHYLVNVGTDGHRLAYVKNDLLFTEERLGGQQVPEWCGDGKEYVLPITGLLQLERIISDYVSGLKEGDEEEDVFVAPDEKGTAIAFAVPDGSILQFMTLNTKYPDHNAILNRKFEESVTVELGSIVGALKRVSVMMDGKKNLSVSISCKNGLLTLEHASPELGEAVETVPCEIIGDGWEKKFNARYLQDGISGVSESEEVRIEVDSEGISPPVRIKGSSNVDRDDYQYIAMPLKD